MSTPTRTTAEIAAEEARIHRRLKELDRQEKTARTEAERGRLLRTLEVLGKEWMKAEKREREEREERERSEAWQTLIEAREKLRGFIANELLPAFTAAGGYRAPLARRAGLTDIADVLDRYHREDPFEPQDREERRLKWQAEARRDREHEQRRQQRPKPGPKPASGSNGNGKPVQYRFRIGNEVIEIRERGS
jgi:hypothetical protein